MKNTNVSGFRIGRHVSTSGVIADLPHYVKNLTYDIFQIFSVPPVQVNPKTKSNTQWLALGENLELDDMYMIIHGSYTINLANPSSSANYKASVVRLVSDLNAASLLGPRCLGVIIHMGKNVKTNAITNDEAIAYYIGGLKEALAATIDSTIVLETGASQGTEVASEIDGLARIWQGLSMSERKRVRFCIDTCHIWATGYDISTVAGVESFFKMFDKAIGIDKINCIHFNDSKNQLGSNVDRHADIGYGYIGLVGLQAVFKFAQSHHIPIIMETHLDAVNPHTNRDITLQDELDLVRSF
jgi:deoxyribonuclease-4